jgi:hypothetical protein
MMGEKADEASPGAKSAPEVNCREALSLLKKAIDPIDNTIGNIHDDPHDLSDLPKAFGVVASHLKLVRDALYHVREKMLKPIGEETQTMRQTQGVIAVAAREARKAADRLNDLFDAVTLTDGPAETKLEGYKKAASNSDRLEVVMVQLLDAVSRVAAVAPGGAEYAGSLAKALEQVKALPASLSEDEGAVRSFVNSGSGNMFNHTGSGSINTNHGNGPMFTGDSSHATMHFGGAGK